MSFVTLQTCDDVVQGYRLLAQHGKAGEIYNLGTGQGTKLASALDHLLKLACRPIQTRVDPDRVRAIDLPFLVADASNSARKTGWKPTYSIEQTLADMLDTFRGLLNPRR